jgi:glycosyltransferase involved in cell wall biosynthesis
MRQQLLVYPFQLIHDLVLLRIAAYARLDIVHMDACACSYHCKGQHVPYHYKAHNKHNLSYMMCLACNRICGSRTSLSMRILIIVHGFPPTYMGGAERRAERTARALAKRGHKVRVFCIETLYGTHDGITWSEHDEQQIIVRRCICRFRQGLPYRASYDNPAIAQALKNMIQAWQPDILHLFSGYLITAAASRVAADHGIPLVVSLTDYWWLCHRINLIRSDGARCDGPDAVQCARCYAETRRRFRLPTNTLPAIGKLFWKGVAAIPLLHEPFGVCAQHERQQVLTEQLQQAAALIAPSHFVAEWYRNHGIRHPRLQVIRQGVELDLCQLHSPSPTLRVGYFGQVKYHKGVDLLLAAWQRLRQTQLCSLIIYGSDTGEPAYGESIRRTISGLARVSWPGTLSSHGVWQALTNIDLLVMPVRWYENSPNIILEAQAMGIPIIATNLGGMHELVHHGKNGLLVDPDNAEALSHVLQRLIDDRSQLAAIRQQPLPFRHFDNEISDLLAIYADVLGKTREEEQWREVNADRTA